MTPVDTAPSLPRLGFEWPHGPGLSEVMTREWLVTNGRGGYASGTVAGCNTRRYHGLFTPNLPGRGRTVLLARLAEEALADGQTFSLSAEEHVGGQPQQERAGLLRGFHLEGLIPVWDYALGPSRLRRKLMMVHGQNTLFVLWEHVSGPEVRLRLRPFPVMRPHDGPLSAPTKEEPIVRMQGPLVELQATPEAPSLRMRLYSQCAAPFVGLSQASPPMFFRTEQRRGYDHQEVQRSPGYFECTVRAGEVLALGITTDEVWALDRDPVQAFELELERERKLLSRAPAEAQTGIPARLVLAADQFIIAPTRPMDDAWSHSVGQDTRSVIAGYHWFTDWGRDTMISHAGLTLSTGRYREAAAILRTFQHYVKDGLIPNYFPDGENEGVYHTADATLWFFHAVDRYVETTGDEALLRDLFPTLAGIVERHQKGTRFHIGVDPADGLLRQGAEGYQLTWMDAKVDGWVVTPRRGKAVEINALWFNALRLMAMWAERLGGDAKGYMGAAERVYGAFNKRFWNPATGCLFDVVDGEDGRDDPAIRPNQVFAISLRFPVLRRERWDGVLKIVHDQLLTPVGLRSLAPGHPDYKAKYDGDLRARDAAYHQGTVWGWLIGHYIDATLKVNPDIQAARALLVGLEHHLEHEGVGQISEIFDATEPYQPRGCIAQAWSVAEALRVFLKTHVT
ncbi:glycogen debranching enzyme, putative [Stigmatella aurantiaca]|uniref:Glycogen debranching enzyme, putative n=1 Tax=Stigmatella aurantiaca TaxID=41 RepID=A0A1H8AJM2_STIAU|nr:amylo-alpha-1,6-glucosidase [Stigmatella aurantiaca]SEM70696.1 glycogen debranching enzyme, putative [Stigmatella aurantiaca]